MLAFFHFIAFLPMETFFAFLPFWWALLVYFDFQVPYLHSLSL